MTFNKSDILFQSLVGTNVSVSKFSIIQNELQKHVLPPIPFLTPLKQRKEGIKKESAYESMDLWQADQPLSKDQQFFPFTFVADDGVRYLLPYEPMVTISGKNTIIRRNVAKITTKGGAELSGSIKERWNQGDYEITITGVLIGSLMTGSVDQCFPKKDFRRLRDFMTTPKSLQVFCEPLQLLGINNIVIEDFTFPFTKGENVQAYEIKAYSDHEYNLLISRDD